MLNTTAPKITPERVASHGLKPDEYQKILALIGREPSLCELGIFSAMWNEHCSYKSSRLHLRGLPTKAEWVIQGPGENAGVIDIGDGDAIIFKMESHNHPSFIEPYQGAGTGVGGILRDVFTMGARPIAALNALRFGAVDHPKTRSLVSGVVAGIAGYGNAFGVPTVGGEVNFHARYNGNILVNAMAVGLAKTDSIFYSKATGVGMPVVYLGAKTGRDGIHGATMASQSFEDSNEDLRPTVQVGDPFREKLLLEATLELMASGAVIAIQDMGAAGLTSSAVEMGAKGNLGLTLELDNVPCREEGMTAYEMMLSESQERMLMVLKPELEDIARAIFVKWDLDFAIVGYTTDTKRFVVKHNGVIEADLPIKELGDEAPLYDRPWTEPAKLPFINASDVKPPVGTIEALKILIGSPDVASRRWIWEQYDHLIGGETLQKPGGDAAVVRIHGTQKAVALCTDVTPRYCEADAFEGGKQAVAEVYRNITAVGGLPLAITDNLNFGNPERPEIMGQFVKCIHGIGAACAALNFPVVSGNVSLYNETDGKSILPTPAIGGVGLLTDWQKSATIALKNAGDAVLLIGGACRHLGATLYLREVCGREEGAPPPVDLAVEKRNGDFVRGLIHTGQVNAVHDISDGGLLVTLAEMCFGSKGLGVRLNTHCHPERSEGSLAECTSLQGDSSAAPQNDNTHAFFFGEDQARYAVTTSAAHAAKLILEAKALNIDVFTLGDVTNSGALEIEGEGIVQVAALKQLHEEFLPKLMGE